MSDTENLTLLGQSKTEYPQTYSPTVLERFHKPLSLSRITWWNWTVPSLPACAR